MSGGSQPQPKRRRWDVASPAPVVSQPPTTQAQQQPSKPVIDAKKSLEVAKATAEALAKRLAQNQPPPSRSQTTNSIPRHNIDIVINDATAQKRRHLVDISGYHTTLCTRWKVQITVKGRYYSPDDRIPPIAVDSIDDGEKPLFLRISPSAALPTDAERDAACRGAADEIVAYMNDTIYAAMPSPSVGTAPYPTLGPDYQCLYFGAFDLPPDFKAADRLQGPEGSYIQHIIKTTGVGCELVGKSIGVIFQVHELPLHLRLSSRNPTALAKAVRLASNLIDTIRDDYRKAYPSLPQPPPSGQYAPPPRFQPPVVVQHAAPLVRPPSYRGPPPPLGGSSVQQQQQQQHGSVSYNTVQPPPYNTTTGTAAAAYSSGSLPSYSAVPPPPIIAAPATYTYNNVLAPFEAYEPEEHQGGGDKVVDRTTDLPRQEGEGDKKREDSGPNSHPKVVCNIVVRVYTEFVFVYAVAAALVEQPVIEDTYNSLTNERVFL